LALKLSAPHADASFGQALTAWDDAERRRRS